MMLLGLEGFLLSALMPGLDLKGWGIAAALTLTYLLLASMVTVTPDTSNLGLFGGLADNPLSFSDDYNRFLLFLKLMLMPGQLVVWSLRWSLRLLVSGGGA
jgi:hypothetical protein